MDTEIIIEIVQLMGLAIAWIAGVYVENTDKQIGRFEFFRWLLGLTIVNTIASLILSPLLDPNSMPILIARLTADILIYGATSFILAKVTVQRFRDINWDKYSAYLLLIPILNLFFLAALCLKAHVKPASSFGVVTKNDP